MTKFTVGVGVRFDEYIDPHVRKCKVIKVTKTCFLIEYELPDGSTTQALRPHYNMEYRPATEKILYGKAHDEVPFCDGCGARHELPTCQAG